MRSGLVPLLAVLLLAPTLPARADAPANPLATQALGEAHAALEGCYRDRLAVRADLEGDVDVRVIVDYAGKVHQLAITRDTTGDPPLVACVKGALETLQMPGSPSGGQFDLPLHFDPQAGVTLGPKATAPTPPAAPPPGTHPERTGLVPPPRAPEPPATGPATPATTPKPPTRPTANPARPTFSDNAVTTEPGALEIEAGGVYTPGPFATSNGAWGLSTLFKYGIADHYDARIGWGETFTGSPGGLLQLIFKTTLVDPEPGRPGLAIEPYLSVATPPAAQANGIGAVLVATLPFASRFELDANVVVQGTWIGPGQYVFEADPVATLSASLLGGLGIFGEVYGLLPTSGGPTAVADAGLTWTAQSNLVFDASVTRVLTASNNPWTVQAGLTYSFYLLGAPPARP